MLRCLSMANRIRILPPEVTMKIAAGEVIERPASIVKELLENAIDAQASSIKVELKEGGKGEITVADNGLGIPPEEMDQAFVRYATSKISEFEDLYTLKSFGFRGEALPSIASVARVEMISRPSEEPTGVRMVVEEGNIIEKSEIGCPVGTLVKVTHLFEHVPARKKFLKSASTEQSYCLEVITRILLGIEHIRAEIITDGKPSILVPASARAEERFAILLGREAASYLVPLIPAADGPYRVNGYISHPQWMRANSKGIYCYVNKRPVRDTIVNHALLTAYKNVLPPGKYPLALIYLDCPPEEVDVNVHPTKMEVRFANPQRIYGLVVEGIIHSMSKFSPEEPKRQEISQRVQEAVERYYVEAKRPIRPLITAPIEERPVDDFTFLGQIDGCYLLFQTPEGLVIVDQHAAHERILFDRLTEKASKTTGESQALLIPIIITLSPPEFSFLQTIMPDLTALGFKIEPFGPSTIAVKAIPVHLSNDDCVSFLQDLVSDPAIRSLSLLERRNKMLATLACKGAIVAHSPLSEEKACNLFRDLKKTLNPATCPHGRPTFVKFSSEDLKRIFKRR